MKREYLAALAVLLAVGLLSGCQEGMISNSTHQQRIADEQARNAELTQEITDLNHKTAELKLDLTNAQRDRDAARLDAQNWQAKHKAAKALLDADTGTQGLPPELLKKFIDIARGPWEIAAGGARLKASSDILFDSGKATLKPGGQTALRDIAPKLKEILTDKRVMLRIDGHTDNQPIVRSGWKDNMELSQERARAVWVSLRGQGIPGETMGAMGFGEYHPIASNADRTGRAQNRRVELSLISVTPPSATP